MPKISSDGGNAQTFTLYPKDWYNAHVRGATIQFTKATGAQMAVIDWKPDEGDAANNPSTIREWVMVKGLAASGEPLRTDRWFERVNVLGIKRDYTCCNQMESHRSFVVNREDGKFHCPHCGNIATIDVDADDNYGLPEWTGKRARIQVTIEKMPNSDDERNRIQRVIPIPK